MAHNDFPRGAGLGRDTNRKKPALVDFAWTMAHGSRAQRREILRQVKVAKRAGVPDADKALVDFQSHVGGRHHAWRVSITGREPFVVVCVQGATAAEMQARYPESVVEAVI